MVNYMLSWQKGAVLTNRSEKKLYAGAGSAEVVFSPEFFPVEGFDGIHDNPHVRILIIDGDIRIAFVACELVVVAKPFVESIKKIINEVAGIGNGNIWVHGTHAISTPHAPGPKPIGPPELRRQPTEEEKLKRGIFTDALNKAAREAAEKAVKAMARCRLGFGRGECDVNISTRELDRRRGMLADTEGIDFCDKILKVLKFEKEDDTPAAIVLNYNLMSNTIDNSEMDKNTRKVSSDVPGKACALLEEKYGVPVLFFMAAGADQKPKEQALYFEQNEAGERVQIDKGVEYGLQLVEKYGSEMAAAAEGIIENTLCDEESPLITTANSSVAVKNRPRGGKPGEGPKGPGGPGKGSGPEGKPAGQGGPGKPQQGPPGGDVSEISVLAARIGDIGLIGTNPELCSATKAELEEKSPFKETLLISFTDGPKGIMADKTSFERGCPEGRGSFAEEGSAEKFVETAVKVLEIL